MAAELEAQLAAQLAPEDDITEALAGKTNDEVRQVLRAIDNEMRIMRSNIEQINYESREQRLQVKDNKEKVKMNKQLPFLVANVVEIVDPYIDPSEDDTGDKDTSLSLECKGVVVKTSTRQTVFLPIPGLIRASEVVPGELVGTNKDSYIMLEKLPTEYDQRVKAMEVSKFACCIVGQSFLFVVLSLTPPPIVPNIAFLIIRSTKNLLSATATLGA